MAHVTVGSASDWVHTNSIRTRDYVEPGQWYIVEISRSLSGGTMDWQANAVGHLVDCTNGGGC
jgi:hypothetical protein